MALQTQATAYRNDPKEWLAHCKHSELVRRLARVASERDLHLGQTWTEGETHILTSPHRGHMVQVSFTTLPLRTDLMIVRSSNWRAEDEVRGVYAIAKARDMYRQLLQAGFVKR